MFNVVISMNQIAKCHSFRTAFTIFFTEIQKKIKSKEILAAMDLYQCCWIEDIDSYFPMRVRLFQDACHYAIAMGYLLPNKENPKEDPKLA